MSAGVSNADPERLKAAAGKLDGIHSRLQAQVNKFQQTVETLLQGWQSDSEGGFMTKYQVDVQAMETMLLQFQEISDHLRDSATDCDKTDGELADKVRALRRR